MERVRELVPLRTAEDRRTQHVLRRALGTDRLAVVASGPDAVVVALALDVPAASVAAVLRHLHDAHYAEAGVTACMRPYCDGVERWRPTAAHLCPRDAVIA